jgi:hypothetical protein
MIPNLALIHAAINSISDFISLVYYSELLFLYAYLPHSGADVLSCSITLNSTWP